MPIQTPFHPRTAALCESQEWRNWSGYLAAGTYEPTHEREYYAIRNAAALIDVSPLFKYEVSGPDALRLVPRDGARGLAWLMFAVQADGRAVETVEKVIDDGT